SSARRGRVCWTRLRIKPVGRASTLCSCPPHTHPSVAPSVGTRRAKTARAKRSSPAPSVDTPTTRTRTRRGTSSPVLYRAGLALRGGNVRRVAAMPRPQFPTNREPLLWPLGVSRNPPPSGGGGCQRRIDALMFDGPQRTAVEIKTNRQDV